MRKSSIIPINLLDLNNVMNPYDKRGVHEDPLHFRESSSAKGQDLAMALELLFFFKSVSLELMFPTFIFLKQC